MTLPRTVVVLVAALLAMAAVVALRAEATRIQFQLSQIDRRAEELLLRLREQELELARLRNPALIRERVAELRLGAAGLSASGGGGSDSIAGAP